MPKKYEVKTGERYGNLEVVREVEPYVSERTGVRIRRVLFKCLLCEKEKEIIFRNVRRGASRSCGCAVSKICRKNFNKGRGSNHPLYKVYNAMVRRCSEKTPRSRHSKNYVDRGVTVCQEWGWDNPAGFENFKRFALDSGWKEGLEVDKDSIHGECLIYSPETVKFVTRSENNTRRRKKSGCSSKFTGVYQANRGWEAEIKFNKKILFRKYFKNEEEAARARDEFIIKNNLPHKRNFPDA